MGSSASVWVLNVAMFLSAIPPRRVALRVIRETQVAARLRQRVHPGEARMCTAGGA
jgi:hypothetical protein